MKRVLYLSTYRFEDLTAFSGTNRRIFDALQGIADYEIEYYRADPNPILRFMVRAIGFLFRLILRRDYQTGFEERLFHSRCRSVQKRTSKRHYDAIVCWQLCFGEVFERFCGAKIFFSDSTFHAIVPYYQWRMDETQYLMIDSSQKKLLNQCDRFWCFSSFFTEDAERYYGIHSNKIVHMHFFPTVFGNGYSASNNESLSLLFVGTNYRDKGTRIAIDTISELRGKYGVSAELKIVGVPNEEQLSMTNICFLGKVSQFDKPERFALLFEEADIFILPTRHECAGIVFTEAASFGLPAVSYRTGGVPDYIEDGFSGYLLEPEATADDFARVIVEKLGTEKQRRAIGQNAFSKYVSEMSQAVFAKKAKDSLDELFIQEAKR